MSEQQRVAQLSDEASALELAYAERPYRELMLTAKSIGHSALAQEMSERATYESDSLSKSNANRSASDQATIDNKSGEHQMNKFDIVRSIADRSPFVGYGWLNTTGASSAKTERQSGGFQHVYSDGLRSQAERLNGPENHTSKQLLGEYAKAGIAEVVTFQSFPKAQFKRFSPQSDKGEESLTVMTYETVDSARSPATDKYGRHHKDGFGRPGNFLTYHLVLPESDARTLQQALYEQPELVHALTETVIRDNTGTANQYWEQVAPPYDAWKQQEGGVGRIAFRDDLTQSADQSRVRAY